MDDPALVQVANGVDDGTDHVSGFFLSVDHFLCDFVVELPAREVLQHQVDVLLIGEVVVELDDVRVLNILHDVYLALK